MKKRLLLIAALAMAVGTSFAQEIGSYVYTATQRVKITGENLVTNGDFSQGKEGWTNAAGEDLNADVWDFGEGEGPNGENVLKSLNGSTADAALCRAWTLTTGKYIVMYDIKGTTTTATGIVNEKANCADFFLTSRDAEFLKKGEDDIQVATVDGFKEDWKPEGKKNAYVFTADEGQKFVMHFEKLAANTMITNIKIFPVEEVFDDRILQSKLDYVDKLLETGKFLLDTENGFIENVVEVLRPMLTEPGALDDVSEVTGLLEEYEKELGSWYDLNASDLLKDEPKWSSYSARDKQNAFGGWKAAAGDSKRWARGKGGANEIVEYGGEEIGHRYQGGVEGNASMYYTITPSIPGTYMLSLDIVGHYMAGTGGKVYNYVSNLTDNYVTDWNRDFKGVTMYAGKDIMDSDAEANATRNIEQAGQKIDCGYINNPNARNNPQKFVVFYDVTQEMVDAKTPVYFGVTYIIDPDRGFSTKLGSNVSLANPQIRLIGVTQDIIDYNNEVKKIIAQQGPLKDRLQWANEDLQKTAVDGYPYGNAALKHVTDSIQPIYDASLLVIDAEGNVLNAKAIQDLMAASATGTGILYSDSLLNAVRAMNSARSAFSNANKLASTTYLEKIADAEAVYADDFYAAGDKETFRVAIAAAVAKRVEILATATDETRDADIETLNAQLDVLAAAVEAFKASANNQPIIDVDFSKGYEKEKDAEGTETGNYILKGNNGQVSITNFNEDNTNAEEKAQVFALGYGEELLDVLRIGNGEAVVEIPEADQPSDTDVLRVNFNLWPGRLNGCYVYFNLLNAAGQRVAGVRWAPYDGTVDYNDFNNEANTGLPVSTDYIPGSAAGDVKNYTEGTKSNITLCIDYKAKAVRGSVQGAKSAQGVLIPIRAMIDDTTPLEDTKVVKLSFGSNYNYAPARRCWFDDLQIYKYPSTASAGIKGDVNGDGDVDVADLIAVSNYMAGDETVSKEKADVNSDGEVNVADLVAISNIMAGTAE